MGVRSEHGDYVPLGSIGSGFSDSQLVRLTNELEGRLIVILMELSLHSKNCS